MKKPKHPNNLLMCKCLKKILLSISRILNWFHPLRDAHIVGLRDPWVSHIVLYKRKRKRSWLGYRPNVPYSREIKVSPQKLTLS